MTPDQHVAYLLIAASLIALGATWLACTTSARAERRHAREAADLAKAEAFFAELRAQQRDDEILAHAFDFETKRAAHTADACDRIASVTPLPLPLRVVPVQRTGGER